jgi:hypothetical protein
VINLPTIHHRILPSHAAHAKGWVETMPGIRHSFTHETVAAQLKARATNAIFTIQRSTGGRMAVGVAAPQEDE